MQEKRLFLRRNFLKIAIVSPYPPPNLKHIYDSGVASYTKNLAEALKAINSNVELHIVTSRENNRSSIYVDNNIMVHRIYERKPTYVFQIFKELAKIRPDIIHIQHEYFLYGKIVSAVLFPLLVRLSKLVSRKVIVTIHGVIPFKLINDKDFRKIIGVRGIPVILKLGILLVTKLITVFADKVIVHEVFLKNSLIRDYKVLPQKIVIIPHGIENVKPLPQNKAKKELRLEGKIVLLYFGYLSEFKGVDILIESFRYLANNNKYVLIIAGGEHPRLKGNKEYEKYLHSLKEKAKQLSDNIVFTGFVPNEKISTYFSAADIVILPYKAVFSSSGPLSLSIAYEKPFLVSDAFKEVIKIKDVIFRDHTELVEKINLILNNKNFRHKLLEYIRLLKKQKKWNEVAKRHLRIYHISLGDNNEGYAGDS